jgi:type I restriction enzyme S subunit
MRNEWLEKCLVEMTEEDSPITYGVVKPGPEGNIKFIRGGDLLSGKILTEQLRTITENVSNQYQRTRLRGGELLICLVGTPGQTGIAPFELAGANIARQVGFIRLKKQFEAKFYSYYFLSPNGAKKLGLHETGSVQRVINLVALKSLKVPCPPLAEQKRIVEILDEAFAAIDRAKANVERNLQNAKHLFESYLQNVFASKGDNWKEKRLGDVCEYDKTHNVRNDLPYVGLEHIESNTGKFLGSVEPQTVKSSTFFFTKAHVLYGRLRPYLNKVLLPEFDGHCSTEIFPIKVSKELDRRFLFYWLTLSETVKKIDATWTGARMPRANMNAVIDFEFYLPQLEEQLSIVRTLDKLSQEISALMTIYQQKLGSLEELKKSLLQKAFTGELTPKAILEV